jgi:hypothetical protein
MPFASIQPRIASKGRLPCTGTEMRARWPALPHVMAALNKQLPPVAFKQLAEGLPRQRLHKVSSTTSRGSASPASPTGSVSSKAWTASRMLGEQLVHGLALADAAGQRRHIGPKTAFFRLVHRDLDVHPCPRPLYGPARGSGFKASIRSSPVWSTTTMRPSSAESCSLALSSSMP